MGGIAGAMTGDGRPPQEAFLTGMGQMLASRGPRGRSRYVNDDIGLIQVSLTTGEVDTISHVGQEAGNLALVSDAPLPVPRESVALYRRDGPAFSQGLQGAFAVALYDADERQIVLTRDRFGIKPLYYAENRTGFAFASTPSALLKAGVAERTLAEATREELLQLQFSTGTETIFRAVRRVLPGETLVVRRGRVVDRIRQPSLPDGDHSVHDEEEALSSLDRLLSEVMERQVGTGENVGLLLSGGLDSAILLQLMRQASEKPVRTFSANVMGVEADEERAVARQLARQAGADHTEITVTETDFWTRLPEIVAAVDDPVADYGLLPMWKLAEAASGEVSVTISGEGADELFAGYSRYRSAVRPWWMGGRAMRHRGILDRTGVLRDAPAGWRDGIVGAESSAAAVEGRSALQVAQAVDVADWLPNDLLIKLDRTMSPHGLEPRTPYLDPELAAFAFSLPDNLKVQGRVGKYLLRRWASDHMGGMDAFRRKRGLALPVGEWIGARANQVWPLIAAQPGIVEVCDPARVEALFRRQGRGIGSAQWLLLFFALWHQIHMVGVAAEGDVLAALAAKG